MFIVFYYFLNVCTAIIFSVANYNKNVILCFLQKK